MSRSTKRKPWYRPRNVLPPVLAVVLTIVGWLTYLVYWALTVQPNPSVDYATKLQELSAASQPPGDNAWPMLAEAARMLAEVQSAMDDPLSPFDPFDFKPLYLEDTSPEVLSKLLHTIAELRAAGAFDQLALAAQRPNAVRLHSYRPDESLIFQTIPDIMELRRLALARIASMYQALAQGDADEAVAALDQTLYVAQAHTHQSLIIEHLIGLAIATKAVGRLRQALMQNQFEAKTYARMLETIQQRLPFGSNEIAIHGERLILLDMIQRVYSDNGKGGGRLLLAETDDILQTGMGSPTSGVPAIVNLGGLLYANRTEITRATNDFFDQFIRLSTLSRAERRADPFDEDVFVQALGWRYTPLNMLIPALGRFVNHRDAVDCEIAGTIIMLALEQYRAQTGQYPDSLQNLTPAIIEAIPSDPFSAEGFVYRKRSDDPLGKGYLLYSIGVDGVDNNGATDSSEPKLALSDYDGFGLDFVLNALKSEK